MTRLLAGEQKDTRGITSEDTKRRRGTRGGKGGRIGEMGKKNKTEPTRTGRGLGFRSRPAGAGSGMSFMKTTEVGRDPCMRKPWGRHGPGNRSRTTRGNNRAGEVRHESLEEILWAARNGREAQTSGGGRRVGAPSRWTVDQRPGERGGRISGRKERERSGVDGRKMEVIGDRSRGREKRKE